MSASTHIGTDGLPDPTLADITLCKVGAGADFWLEVEPGPDLPDWMVHLEDGECQVVFTYIPAELSKEERIRITEHVPAGVTLDKIVVNTMDDIGRFLTETVLNTNVVLVGIRPGYGQTVGFFNSRECTGEIGDFVWNDSGGTKGIQDPGEVGLVGIVVNLFDGAMNLIATTTTDANGFYLFTGLCAGDYKVMVDETTVPAGWMQTPTLIGGDPTLDNNPNPAMVNLPTDNGSDLTIDFGYMEPPPPGGGEGCTPGYYKNLKKHLFAWMDAGHDPDDLVSSVFNESANAPYAHLGAATLHDGLSFQGGSTVAEKAETLLRAAIAAVLNADNPNIDYAFSSASIVADVNAALAGQNPVTIISLKDDLDVANNKGCDLGNGP